MTETLIIGIAGGTASGKTTFAEQLFEAHQYCNPILLTLDSYYHRQDHLTPEKRVSVNYDHPDSFEISLLVENINTLRSGNEVATPNYDFCIHTRSAISTLRSPSPLIIIEGILTLHYLELKRLLDYKLFVDTPSDIRYQRRLSRDIQERNRTPADIEQQWQTTVEPMHLKYCEPSRHIADYIIRGEGDYLAEINKVSERVIIPALRKLC